MNKKLWLLNGFALSIGFLALTFLWMQTPKTAYIDLGQLYESFNGKKELSNRLMQFENQQKAELDSLAMHIHALQQYLNKNEGKAVLANLNEQQSKYNQMQQDYFEQYQEQDQQLAREVWKHINQYVKEFGEQNGYDYIYGTAGDGSLMYGNAKRNITSQVLQFINEKYEGA